MFKFKFNKWQSKRKIDPAKCTHKELQITSFRMIDNSPFNDCYFYCKCKECGFNFDYEEFWIKKDKLSRLLIDNIAKGHLTKEDISDYLFFEKQKYFLSSKCK